MKKQTVALDVFQKFVLPTLQTESPDVEQLQKAIDDGYVITDTDGDAVEFKVAGGKKKAAEAVAVAELKDNSETFEKINKALDGIIEKMGQSVEVKTIGKITDRADADPKFGFKSFAEQALLIKGYYTGDQEAKRDERMQRIIKGAPTAGTFANEGLGADGGFLLAPNFSEQILAHTFVDEALFNRTMSFTTGSNSLTVPKDETSPWGTSGVQCYWQSEASAVTGTKPAIGQDNLVLQKVSALVPVSDEMLTDSFTGLGDYIAKLAGPRIRFKVDDAIVNGSGAGQPLGVLNSGAIVSQAAESAQTADTINITNLAKMLSRVPDYARQGLVWLVHPSALPQLVILTNGNQSIYIPPGGVSGANPRPATLFGIPLQLSQHCQAVGDVGDILLLDLSQYITLTKGNGIDSAMSMHLYFDANTTAFRFNFRVAGQPWMSAPITSYIGSYSMSPFVSLAAR